MLWNKINAQNIKTRQGIIMAPKRRNIEKSESCHWKFLEETRTKEQKYFLSALITRAVLPTLAAKMNSRDAIRTGAFAPTKVAGASHQCSAEGLRVVLRMNFEARNPCFYVLPCVFKSKLIILIFLWQNLQRIQSFGVCIQNSHPSCVRPNSAHKFLCRTKRKVIIKEGLIVVFLQLQMKCSHSWKELLHR